MKDKLTATVLFRILTLAPMRESESRFKQLAKEGDVEAFFRYYERSLENLPQLDEQIERAGQVSFRMLRPAMTAVYMAGRSA